MARWEGGGLSSTNPLTALRAKQAGATLAQRTWPGGGRQQKPPTLSAHPPRPGKSGRLEEMLLAWVLRGWQQINTHRNKETTTKITVLPGLSPRHPRGSCSHRLWSGWGPGLPKKGDLCEGSKTRDSRRGGLQTQFGGLHSISFISIKHRDAAAQRTRDTSISGVWLALRESSFRKTNKRINETPTRRKGERG